MQLSGSERGMTKERRNHPSGISSRGGKGWRDTTIRGHATRRTGILHNGLYAGRLLWNKQTCVRDPDSGKRLARMRKAEENVVFEVLHLRIVGQEVVSSFFRTFGSG